MFITFNYFKQHNDNQPIDDYKNFYRSFSNKREFGGDYSHMDHLVGSRFTDNLQVVYNAILRQLPQKILDVGCGTGVNLPLSKMFSQIEYHGIDYAEMAVSTARKTYPNVEFYVGDAFEMEFESETFDLVILSNVLILYSNPAEQKRLIRECLRVLGKDGILVLVVWNDAPLLRWSIKLSRVLGRIANQRLPEDFMAVSFSVKEVREIVDKSGGFCLAQTKTSELHGVNEAVQHLSFAKYRRTFGADESELCKHPQNPLSDLIMKVRSHSFLVKFFYFVARMFPSTFSFYSVSIVGRKSRIAAE